MDTDEGPYEILPYKEIAELKKQVKKLKGTDKPASTDLVASINSLTKNMDNMLELFKTASKEMEEEVKEESWLAKNIKPMMEKIDKVIEQNKTIAEGMVTIADMVKEFTKRFESESLVGLEDAPSPNDASDSSDSFSSNPGNNGYDFSADLGSSSNPSHGGPPPLGNTAASNSPLPPPNPNGLMSPPSGGSLPPLGAGDHGPMSNASKPSSPPSGGSLPPLGAGNHGPMFNASKPSSPPSGGSLPPLGMPPPSSDMPPPPGMDSGGLPPPPAKKKGLFGL